MRKLSVYLQIVIAAVVTLAVIALGILVGGPDIDDKVHSFREIVQGICFSLGVVAIFIAAAILLKRGTKTGFWLSVAIDLLLGCCVGAALWSDIADTSIENAEIFRGDLMVHVPILLLTVGTVIVLLVSLRRRKVGG